MMRKVAHHIDLTAGIDSAQWEQFLPPAEKWVVLGQPASTTEQTQEQTQTVRSVSPTPASMRGLTPAEFRDLQHHQAMVFNAASQAQPESQQQPPVELVAGIENHEERAEDLEQTAKFLPFFEWEESEEKELKVRMAQAPELKFYPDVVSHEDVDTSTASKGSVSPFDERRTCTMLIAATTQSWMSCKVGTQRGDVVVIMIVFCSFPLARDANDELRG
ncbi:hypothetical protein BLNAU_1329 [Blattamonas nauphoetae]|uniref:Uncharacterized protein n=1 Tax=Blattamonas nauphoetae TaxID=2049346 RepID=A0ABQ9YJ44_9EUKA|nr:hypothetical protein BLNAU_1329 [Blattamonas nauphoetae]